MILIQFSSAQGPDECALATYKALHFFLKEAKTYDVDAQIQECEEGRKLGTVRSVLLSLDGEQANILVNKWVGTVQWVCQSPYRPNHGRKNWFIGVQSFTTEQIIFDDKICFEAIKASGPGGQHVNKTCSAVRATHLATGISVKVQNERSQYANKKLAKLLIQFKLNEQQNLEQAHNKAQRRLQHHQLERGNPIRVFTGMDFKER
ncbi:peptide chain release factor H [Neisseria sp. Ec49-e6-T10]|uniref:peptide chain release factor H n=1 Tax=Neisseria sp. Ec49-e6-T10 TaxID=3140744 RepID=UPI003EBC2002